MSASYAWRKELNQQQWQAVSGEANYRLVIAGAGTGKTHTLTHRVNYLITQGVDLRQMLLVTFTNKAAQEMTARIGQLSVQDMSSLWSGTFHAIGSRLLRKHGDIIQLNPLFSIIDSGDQKKVMQQLVNEQITPQQRKNFVKADIVLYLISLANNQQTSLPKLVAEQFPYWIEHTVMIERLAEHYEQYKWQIQALDFDDILLYSLQLLENNSDLRERYQQRFRYLFIDEYQDTNNLQHAFIAQLLGKDSYLMAVGDDAQSIYAWRGANLQHMLNFTTHYPQAVIYRIEQNYRSTQAIIKLSNSIISHNQQQYQKTITSEKEEGEIPTCNMYQDFSHQAHAITQKIKCLQQAGVASNEIAILYRSHYQSMAMQMTLVENDIDFQLTSGVRFFEQAHIKDLLAILLFVANPQDKNQFERMAQLVVGVGKKTLANAWLKWHTLSAHNNTEAWQHFNSLVTASRAKESWQQLTQTVLACQQLIAQHNILNSGELAQVMLQFYQNFYCNYLFQQYKDAENREKDIETLLQYIAKFTTLTELLEAITLHPAPHNHAADNYYDKITLSTIHQAKGKEWHTVFILSLCDYFFPSQKVLQQGDDLALEEERRLFYVAVTRAKQHLYLATVKTNPQSYQGNYYLRPSLFLREIKAENTLLYLVDDSY